MLVKFRQGCFLRRAASVALLSILFQILVPFIHQAPAYATVAKVALRVCSSHTQDNSGKVQPDKLPVCPVCQTMHLLHGGFVAPPDIVIALVKESGDIIRPVTGNPLTYEKLLTAARPRAPPVFV